MSSRARAQMPQRVLARQHVRTPSPARQAATLPRVMEHPHARVVGHARVWRRARETPTCAPSLTCATAVTCWGNATCDASSNCSECSCHQGDVNGDGVVDITDYVYLLNNVRRGIGVLQREQNCPAVSKGDVNCDGLVNKADITYLYLYLMSNGPAPCNPCECNPYPTGCSN